MSLDFKLQFYFNLYKDKGMPNRAEFRNNFKKSHGEFAYVEELIIMIERYQIKKYGCTLTNGKRYTYKSREECLYDNAKERQRKNNKRR